MTLWNFWVSGLYPSSQPFRNDTMGLTPASLVFGRELQLPCNLQFHASPPPPEERPTINQAANLVNHLHDIHNYARQHLKLARG
jgi:hypothetical protein